MTNQGIRDCLPKRTLMIILDGLRSSSSESSHPRMRASIDLDSWFIKEGQEVSVSDGIRRRYGATLAQNEHHLPRHAQIVMSTLPVKQLPQLMTDAGCQQVVSVNYRLTGNDMKLKNRQVWRLKKKYWKADFSFVVKLGPADLKFQILGKNGVLSSDHDSLKVEFMDPSELKSPRPLPVQHVSVRSMPSLKDSSLYLTGEKVA